MTFEIFHQTTVNDLITYQADQHPNRAFLTLGDDHWTYMDVAEAATRLAGSLSTLNLERGDRIATILPNIPEFVITLFGAATANLIIVPVNVRRSQSEIVARLEKTQPRAIVTFSDPHNYDNLDHVEIVQNIQTLLPGLEHIITTEKDREGILSFEELCKAGAPPPDGIIPPEDPVAIIHTLGSSGEPRGATLTHGGLMHNAALIAEVMSCTEDDVFLGAVPFSNTFGLTGSVLACAVAGARLVCLPKYHPGEALSLIAQEKVSVHHGVPTMFAMELNYPDIDAKSISSLRTGIISGAPCPPELVNRVRKQMGFDLLTAYGLTEASPFVTITHLDDGPVTATQTVGRPLEGMEIKVIDPDGSPVHFGVIGELIVRGESVMRGYWEDAEASERVLDADGWLHTGDLAVIDPDGPVRIVGRKEDVIIRGGFKIYPGTVEMVLNDYPGVLEAAVVGVPDLIFGELSYACVVPQPETTITEQALLKHAAEHLAEYALPDRVIFFDALPRRGSGPVQKSYLRERVRIRGKSWKFGKNIDTDAIIPARHCNTSDPNELALHCMEDASPDFVHNIKRGDIIVADSNFGCGSSREVAPLTIKAAGISAVIAKSFARIFFRNAINIGLPILECTEAVDGIQEGDEVEVEPSLGIIRNLTRDEEYQSTPFPEFLQAIIDRGGLLAYVEERIQGNGD